MTVLRNLSLMGSALVLALFASSAMAAGGFYAGLKGGQFEVDVDEIDSDLATGFQLGYEFNFGLAIQVEALSSEPDFDTGVGFIAVSGEAEIDTLGLYAVYRTPGNFFFMAKGGWLDEEVTVDTPVTPKVSESDTGFSAGIGGGFRFGEHFILEGELTVIEQDVVFIGVSANVQF